MATKPLMEKAAAFKKPDVASLVPPDVKDAVDRVVAAGVKMMYAPEMKEKLAQAVQSKDPVPKKLAENVTGLLLLLDTKSQGGLPVKALFPAAMELLGEAAEVLAAAGQQITQADYNEAAMLTFTTIGRKLGATDEQMMGAAEQAIGGGAADGADGGEEVAEEVGEGGPADPVEPEEPMPEEPEPPAPEEEEEPMP